MSTSDFIESLEEKLVRREPDLSRLSADEQFELITSKAADLDEPVVTKKLLHERLSESKKSGRPLRIKFGIDPTGPEIHLGHAVILLNLRRFQLMGHTPVFIVGDFTGMIGDPSGRSDARSALTEDDVRRNMETYQQQAQRIFDIAHPGVERHHNSTWMKELSVRDWVEVAKRVPIGNLLQREDFRNRMNAGQGMSLAELEYSVFMGYDSVHLRPDVELGGVDQYLNMHMGRQMMHGAAQPPQVIIAYNLLPGTTGELDAQGRLVKMSKSKGNYIPVVAEPADMYGKVMSIPDDVMWVWYRELTLISAAELARLRSAVGSGEVHPKAAKQLLARAVVAEFNGYSADAVAGAERAFTSKFGKAALDKPLDTKELGTAGAGALIELLSAATGKSKSELRRLATQKAIRVLEAGDYTPLDADALTREASSFSGKLLRVGKLSYFSLS